MALELIDLHHRFGRIPALAGVNVRVERGDCYGFLGHNGAGKTTAMRIALGLLPMQRGCVRVDGHVAAREHRARTRGLIEQPGLFRELSGAANLVRLARLEGLPRREATRAAARVLDLVGLTPHAGQRAGTYSQGMRQRLGVAQALLLEPAYVLLDEPMNGLDPEGIAELRALLRTLRQQARCTVFLSSHQLHELEGLCTRVGILRAGKMLFEGTPQELAREQAPYRVVLGEPRAAQAVWARLGLQTAGAGADDDGNAGHDNAGTVEVDLKGHAPDAVLAEVVRAGARPRAFAPLPQTLEALYLAVTRQPAPESAARPAPAATVTLTPRCAPAWITGCARTVRYELARLARTPTLLIFALPAALTALRVWSRRAEVARDLARVRARELFSATDSSGYDAVGVAMQQATPLLAFLLLGLASQSYASELAQGTLRNLLLRPIARGGVWLGKLAAQMLAAVAAFALAAGTALALAATLIGFGDAAEVTRHGDRTPLIAEADIAPHLLPALAHTLPALLSYVALGLCIGALTRRPAVALGLALALGVGLDVGRGLVPETWLPSAALPSPLRDTSHLRAFTDLAFGRADALFPDDARAAVVALLWSMGAVVVGLIVCKRRAVP